MLDLVYMVNIHFIKYNISKHRIIWVKRALYVFVLGSTSQLVGIQSSVGTGMSVTVGVIVVAVLFLINIIAMGILFYKYRQHQHLSTLDGHVGPFTAATGSATGVDKDDDAVSRVSSVSSLYCW